MSEFRISGRMLTFSRATLSGPQDVALLMAHLGSHPNLRGTPLLLQGTADIDLVALVGQLRALGIQVLGVTAGGLSEQAQALGLAILPMEQPIQRIEPTDASTLATAAGSSLPHQAAGTDPPVAATNGTAGVSHARAQSGPTAAATPPADTGGPAAAVTAPVQTSLPLTVQRDMLRSGQQLCIERGDVVLLNDQNSGNELFAAGSIHVYGKLRGRVMAGIFGDSTAQIFCQNLQAELIGIAGNFILYDAIPEEMKYQAVRVYLDEHDELQFEKMPAIADNRPGRSL